MPIAKVIRKVAKKHGPEMARKVAKNLKKKAAKKASKEMSSAEIKKKMDAIAKTQPMKGKTQKDIYVKGYHRKDGKLLVEKKRLLGKGTKIVKAGKKDKKYYDWKRERTGRSNELETDRRAKDFTYRVMSGARKSADKKVRKELEEKLARQGASKAVSKRKK